MSVLYVRASLTIRTDFPAMFSIVDHSMFDAQWLAVAHVSFPWLPFASYDSHRELQLESGRKFTAKPVVGCACVLMARGRCSSRGCSSGADTPAKGARPAGPFLPGDARAVGVSLPTGRTYWKQVPTPGSQRHPTDSSATVAQEWGELPDYVPSP